MNAQEARQAVDYLLDSAAEYAAARADVIRTDHMAKVTRALAEKSSNANTVGARQADAVTSPAYQKAMEEHFAAVRDMEELRAKREAASARIEFWRSYEASHRNAERGFHSARGAA